MPETVLRQAYSDAMVRVPVVSLRVGLYREGALRVPMPVGTPGL